MSLHVCDVPYHLWRGLHKHKTLPFFSCTHEFPQHAPYQKARWLICLVSWEKASAHAQRDSQAQTFSRGRTSGRKSVAFQGYLWLDWWANPFHSGSQQKSNACHSYNLQYHNNQWQKWLLTSVCWIPLLCLHYVFTDSELREGKQGVTYWLPLSPYIIMLSKY